LLPRVGGQLGQPIPALAPSKQRDALARPFGAFEGLWSASALQHFHPGILREAFPGWEGSYSRMTEEQKVFAPSLDGNNVWPCSFWIKRTA
jgi:hypothetical protein